MSLYKRLNAHSLLLLLFITIVALLSSGCSSSTTSSPQVNPLGAYQAVENNHSGTPTSGTVTNAGAIDSPIVTTPTDGNSGVNGHSNAPLLNNMHAGWQQSDCLSCHNDTTRNPDHNYTDTKQCYLCHGTNGLPGFGDKVPPVISGVVSNPGLNSVVISWNTDEESLSRLVLRTVEGDRLEFPVSMTYTKSHRYEVKGLVSGKTYTYELICTDRNGNRASSSSFGTLSFTTLTPTSTTASSTSSVAPVDNFFSNVSVVPDSPFGIKLHLVTKSAAKVLVYIIDAKTNQLVSSPTLNHGNPIAGEGTALLPGMTPNTSYKILLSAVEVPSSVQHKSAYYKVTTPSV